jgi:hypothetical protein
MLKTLLEEMVNYPTRDNVLPKYQIVLQKIEDIFVQIKESKDEELANQYFDQLQEIQSPLAILVFKEKIDEYSRINKFVSDFDRIDDFRLRKYMFNAIKNENYALDGEE